MSLSPLARSTIKLQAVQAEMEHIHREPIKPSIPRSPPANISVESLPESGWFWEDPNEISEVKDDGTHVPRQMTPFEGAMLPGKKA